MFHVERANLKSVAHAAGRVTRRRERGVAESMAIGGRVFDTPPQPGARTGARVCPRRVATCGSVGVGAERRRRSVIRRQDPNKPLRKWPRFLAEGERDVEGAVAVVKVAPFPELRNHAVRGQPGFEVLRKFRTELKPVPGTASERDRRRCDAADLGAAERDRLAGDGASIRWVGGERELVAVGERISIAVGIRRIRGVESSKIPPFPVVP